MQCIRRISSDLEHENVQKLKFQSDQAESAQACWEIANFESGPKIKKFNLIQHHK